MIEFWCYSGITTYYDIAFGGNYPCDQWVQREYRLLVFPDGAWLLYRNGRDWDSGDHNPPVLFSM